MYLTKKRLLERNTKLLHDLYGAEQELSHARSIHAEDLAQLNRRQAAAIADCKQAIDRNFEDMKEYEERLRKLAILYPELLTADSGDPYTGGRLSFKGEQIDLAVQAKIHNVLYQRGMDAAAELDVSIEN